VREEALLYFFKSMKFMLIDDIILFSALDLFGGKGVKYTDCVEWNRNHSR